MPDDIFLDLQAMFPPEPMERVLDALASLLPDQQLRIVIDREPLPLYRILERNAYKYEASQPVPGEYHIVIRQAN